MSNVRTFYNDFANHKHICAKSVVETPSFVCLLKVLDELFL